MKKISILDVVRIIVEGEPRPYIARPAPYKRTRRGKAGQAVGSIGMRMIKPDAHQAYQDRIKAEAARQMAGRAPIEDPVRLTIRAYVPIPKTTTKAKRAAIAAGELLPVKRPDLTNITKLAEDALSSIVFRDDNQVVRGSDDSGRYFSDRPRIEIEVTPLGRCPLQAAEMETQPEGPSTNSSMEEPDA